METIAQTHPAQSLEVLTEHVRHGRPVRVVRRPGGPPLCTHGRGVHVARFVSAMVLGEITAEEMAVVIAPWPDGDFHGCTIIRAGDLWRRREAPAVPGQRPPHVSACRPRPGPRVRRAPAQLGQV